MSRPTAAASASERGRFDRLRRRLGGLRRAVAARSDRPLTAALGLAAVAPVAALTLARVLRNSPAGLPAAARPAVAPLATLAAVVPPLAFLGLGIAAERRPTRTAFLALGVFPLLAVPADGAWLAAAGAVVVASAAALSLALSERFDGSLRAALPRAAGPLAVSVLGVAALGASLAGAAGVAPLSLVPLGATAAFATLAAVALARLTDGADLVVWVGAAVAIGWWATGAPYVAGAVTLVAFGAGQVPFLLLALGLGGALAATVAAVRRGAVGPAVGTLLLLFAGVPGRLPRATAFALGLVVLVRTWDAGGDASGSTGARPAPGGDVDA